jgi:hypothetical protein
MIGAASAYEQMLVKIAAGSGAAPLRAAFVRLSESRHAALSARPSPGRL